ncbi:MAG: hypothetical protein HC767_04210 [Akkermansiaceae bacterium]|nr:hypothetical protein [Akkermansiaceae bacterium]
MDIIIGTTALNNPQEIFSSLGLVVIDEQHRFGVKQRANLVKKNPDAAAPHVLFATATPIPRTVAMTHMSHMTTSVIDELPPGRLPVEYAATATSGRLQSRTGSCCLLSPCRSLRHQLHQLYPGGLAASTHGM